MDGKTVSLDAARRRASTGVNSGLAVILTVPLIGMLLGAVLVIQMVVRALLVSGQRLKDFALLSFVTVIGFVGMVAALFSFAGPRWGVALAFLGDLVLNLWIVHYALNKKLVHLWATPTN